MGANSESRRENKWHEDTEAKEAEAAEASQQDAQEQRQDAHSES